MKKFVGFNRKGFTLIEVIVVAAIIAILAGILVPMIFNQIDESKKTKAQGDCKNIQSAIMAFRGNVGLWPHYSNPTKPLTDAANAGKRTLLNSGTKTDATELPTLTGAGYVITDVDTFDNQLNLNKPSGDVPYDTTKFKGPYLSGSTLDPWGKAYVVNADVFDAFDSSTPPIPFPVWVISAGPDGIIQTPAAATSICTDPANNNAAISLCDDIGIRIK